METGGIKLLKIQYRGAEIIVFVVSIENDLRKDEEWMTIIILCGYFLTIYI